MHDTIEYNAERAEVLFNIENMESDTGDSYIVSQYAECTVQ